MSCTDYLRIREHNIFKELSESLPKNITRPLNLLTVGHNVLFTWDFNNNCVSSLNLKAARIHEANDVNYQKLLPLHPPLFSPEFLIVNDIGTLLVVAGSCGILCLELPPRCPPYGAFDNNKEVVYCKTYSLDERLLSCSDIVEVRQVKFHPGSINHNHIVALTSDNMLRLYHVKNGEAFNVAVYSVGEKPTTLFPGSKTSFLDIYGEVAVDFDFGHPVVSQISELNVNRNTLLISKSLNKNIEEKIMINVETQTVDKISPKHLMEKENDKQEWNNLVWPIFILRSDTSIYSVNIDLRKRTKVVLEGPLPMTSFNAEQNEACSLICLNTSPQIVCIALSNGTLCHSILLDFEQNEVEHCVNQTHNKELLGFETVELELGLTTYEECQLKYKCPISLKKDDLKPERYYAIHRAGVHSVVICCINDLQEFFTSPEDGFMSDIFINPTKAQYLICTKTATSEKSNPVVGFSLYYEPTSVITLMADGSLITLGVMFSDVLTNTDYKTYSDEGNHSPLKKMLQEPFEQYIGKILVKTSTQPILKLPPSNENNLEEYYDVLQRATQVFRDDYFKNQIKAREEVEKRIKTLYMMKRNQQKEIENMKNKRDVLREEASNLAEKYEDIKDKQDELLRRAENLLMLVSRKKSLPSEAEQTFLKELQNYSEKIVFYGNKIDKIKSKMKYQQIQMNNWNSQEIKCISAINETHTDTIKTNLQETTKKMGEMMKQINEFKKYLNLK